MSAAEKANLARIRDNQRRSRARRKEYLQELEARLRQCELQGIEASSEIQHAARRVADENKKLRLLLSRHGVGYESIETFLQGTVSPDAMMGDPGFTRAGVTNSSGAVQVLEELLRNKKYFYHDGTTHIARGGSRESSVASMSTVQSLWDPNFNNHARRQSENLSMGAGPYMTDVGRHGLMASLGQRGRTPVQQQQQQQHQQDRITSMATPVSSATCTTSNRSPHTQAMYEFDPQLSLHQPTFQQHRSHGNITTHTQLAQAHTASHPLAPVSRPGQYIPTTTTSETVAGTSSCVFATDMITTVAGGDPHVVRTDLGCILQGMECQVDNQLVFNVMDRYIQGQESGSK